MGEKTASFMFSGAKRRELSELHTGYGMKE